MAGRTSRSRGAVSQAVADALYSDDPAEWRGAWAARHRSIDPTTDPFCLFALEVAQLRDARRRADDGHPPRAVVAKSVVAALRKAAADLAGLRERVYGDVPDAWPFADLVVLPAEVAFHIERARRVAEAAAGHLGEVEGVNNGLGRPRVSTRRSFAGAVLWAWNGAADGRKRFTVADLCLAARILNDRASDGLWSTDEPPASGVADVTGGYRRWIGPTRRAIKCLSASTAPRDAELDVDFDLRVPEGPEWVPRRAAALGPAPRRRGAPRDPAAAAAAAPAAQARAWGAESVRDLRVYIGWAGSEGELLARIRTHDWGSGPLLR